MVTQTRLGLSSRSSRMNAPTAMANTTSSRSSSPPTPNAAAAAAAAALSASRSPRPPSGASASSTSISSTHTPLAPDVLISHLSIVGTDHPHNFVRHHSTGVDGTTTTNNITSGKASKVAAVRGAPTPPLYVRRPSAPIAIPIHQSIRIRRSGSTPSSPLSARGEEKTSYFPFVDPSTKSSASRSSSRTPSPRVRMNSSSRMMSSSASTTATSPARSPLSGPVGVNPKTRASPKSPPPAGGFQSPLPSHLASLPRYHPAVMAAASARSSSSSQSSSAASTPARQYSDAQMTLHLYQREMIVAATNAKKAAAASANAQSPTPPRLEPLGSPTEVMTPLVLNESGGYLAAGAQNRRN